jgi:hypothetical protein
LLNGLQFVAILGTLLVVLFITAIVGNEFSCDTWKTVLTRRAQRGHFLMVKLGYALADHGDADPGPARVPGGLANLATVVTQHRAADRFLARAMGGRGDYFRDGLGSPGDRRNHRIAVGGIDSFQRQRYGVGDAVATGRSPHQRAELWRWDVARSGALYIQLQPGAFEASAWRKRQVSVAHCLIMLLFYGGSVTDHVVVFRRRDIAG